MFFPVVLELLCFVTVPQFVFSSLFYKLVNQSLEHYRRVTIDLFFGSTVNGVRQCAFVNVEVTSYCLAFLCSVIRVEKSLRLETDLSHLAGVNSQQVNITA